MAKAHDLLQKNLKTGSRKHLTEKLRLQKICYLCEGIWSLFSEALLSWQLQFHGSSAADHA